MRRLAPAFTLAELLVALAVVALLIASQVPALTRARPPVQLVQCLSNSRQVAVGITLYRADNYDAFPYAARSDPSAGTPDPTSWPMKLLDYVGCDTNPSAWGCY